MLHTTVDTTTLMSQKSVILTFQAEMTFLLMLSVGNPENPTSCLQWNVPADLNITLNTEIMDFDGLTSGSL